MVWQKFGARDKGKDAVTKPDVGRYLVRFVLCKQWAYNLILGAGTTMIK